MSNRKSKSAASPASEARSVTERRSQSLKSKPRLPKAATEAGAADPSDAKSGKPKRSKDKQAKSEQAGKSVKPAKSKAERVKADKPKQKSKKDGKAAKPVVPPASEPTLVVVREVKDRFRMPEPDHALIAELKKRAKKAGRKTSKSELLRSGLKLLNALEPAELVTALHRLLPAEPASG